MTRPPVIRHQVTQIPGFIAQNGKIEKVAVTVKERALGSNVLTHFLSKNSSGNLFHLLFRHEPLIVFGDAPEELRISTTLYATDR